MELKSPTNMKVMSDVRLWWTYVDPDRLTSEASHAFGTSEAYYDDDGFVSVT